MEKVRYGIIGVGVMGTCHAKYLLEGEIPNAVLTAVCDIDEVALNNPLFVDTAKFENYIDLLDSGLVDAVLVATPHYDHLPIGKAALARDIHLLGEKPVAVDKYDALLLNEASKNSKALFGIMFMQRTYGIYRKVKELLVEGAIGDIVRVNWINTDWFRTESYYKSGKWRASWAGEGGGVLVNQSPHNMDLLQWLCGMPKKVRAFCKIGSKHDIEVEDMVTAYLEYENGATGVFITTTGEFPGTNRLEIAGDKGKIVVENNKVFLTINSLYTSDYCKNSDQKYADNAQNIDFNTVEVEVEGEPFNGPHQAITDSFTKAILNGTPLVANGTEGINSVELANSMLYSSIIGDTVTLPLDADAYHAELLKLKATSRYKG